MRDTWADPVRWCHISAIIGSILWLVLLGALPVSGDDISTATYLVLLALLVVAPLTIGLAAPAPDMSALDVPRRLFRLAVAIQPAASLLAVTSFYVPSGSLAALLTLGWLLLCAIVALLGCERLYRRGRRIEEICIGVGLLLLPIAGAWLYQARVGSIPGSDGGAILAAMNAHYALFATPVLAGMVGRALPRGRTWRWRTFRAAARGVIVGTLLLAIGGIVAPSLDTVARAILAAALLALALLTILAVAPRTRPFLAAALLAVSGVAMLLPLLLAWTATIGALAGGGSVGSAPTPTSHGVANALGFVLCGLLAWSIIRPAAH